MKPRDLDILKRLADARRRHREAAYGGAVHARQKFADEASRWRAAPAAAQARPITYEPTGADLKALDAYAGVCRHRAAVNDRAAEAFTEELALRRAELETAVQRDDAIGRLRDAARSEARQQASAREEAAREDAVRIARLRPERARNPYDRDD